MLVQRVERRGRFVEQQHLPRLARPQLRQHPRQVHALAFAAGQRQVAAPGQMAGVGRRQGLGDDLHIALAAAGMGQPTEADHRLHRKGEAQRRTLRQHRQALRASDARPVVEAALVEQHQPFGRLQFATESAKQGALASAVGAEYAEHLARPQLQLEAFQYSLSATADGQVLHAQHQARPRNSR